MIDYDYHTHTAYCDGADTVEDMIKAAIDKKMSAIGFSGHSYTDFDKSWCMSVENTEKYKNEIALMKQKYKSRIKVLCGIEQDYYSNMTVYGYDYVIGSVHYIKVNNDYIPIDENEEILLSATKKYFENDIYSLIEMYYETLSNICIMTKCDIIAHFDLISKFNERFKLFDERNKRYITAYQLCVDKLLKFKKPFEINLGAIIRGYRSTAYPSAKIIEYIRDNGGSFILSSDSHSKNTLCYNFDFYEDRLLKLGCKFVNII